MATSDRIHHADVRTESNCVFDVIKDSRSGRHAVLAHSDIRRAISALQSGPVSFCRNNVIACQGDDADYMFMVVSGVVRACKIFQNGDRAVVAFYLPGDLLGWCNNTQSLSIEAATNAVVLFFKRRPLVSMAAHNPSLARLLLDLATKELCRAHEHAALLSRDAKSRVVLFLSELKSRSAGKDRVVLGMSHQDIADHLGLTIETLSRMITSLERSGAIRRAAGRTLLLRDAWSPLRITLT